MLSHAKYIKANNRPAENSSIQNPAPRFRKVFTLPGDPVAAQLYCTGLGTIPLYRRCRSGGMGVGLVRSKCPSVPGVFMMIPFPLFGFEIHSTLRLK